MHVLAGVVRGAFHVSENLVGAVVSGASCIVCGVKVVVLQNM